MKEYVELADRVLELEVIPDTPGICRRTLRVEVVSGPPLTLDEYHRATAAVVAELVSRGNDVYSWRGITDGGEGDS